MIPAGDPDEGEQAWRAATRQDAAQGGGRHAELARELGLLAAAGQVDGEGGGFVA